LSYDSTVYTTTCIAMQECVETYFRNSDSLQFSPFVQLVLLN
jgi:hypothetical protein